MIPLIVLLFFAVGTRIFKYGITEYRYFLILLACWLLFITTYFLVSRKQNIKLIPMSLCVLTLLSIYGPQSAFSVSMYSQRRVLVNIFKRNNYFKNDKLMPVDSNKIPHKEGNEAVEMLDYMVNHYDLTSLQPYINKDLTAVGDSLMKVKIYRYGGIYYSSISVDKYELKRRKEQWIEKYLNLGKFPILDDLETPHPDLNYHFSVLESGLTNVKNYDFILRTNSVLYNDDEKSDTINYVTDKLNIQTVNKNGLLVVKINDEKVDFNLKDLIAGMLKDTDKLKTYRDTAKSNYQTDFRMPQNVLSFSRQTKNYTITLVVNDITFYLSAKRGLKDLSNFESYYLIKIK